MVLKGNRDGGVEDGEKDRGEAIHISIVWDLFSKYIYLGPGPDLWNWDIQVQAPGTYRGTNLPGEVQLQTVAKTHRLNPNYALVFSSVKYKSNVCPAYL